MSLNHFVTAFARRRSGSLVLGGIAAVLNGVERLMAPSRTRPNSAVKRDHGPLNRHRVRKDFFSIKRTHSDLGFTYWVLQGHGIFASFELFDTWAEAVARAESRLAKVRPGVLMMSR